MKIYLDEEGNAELIDVEWPDGFRIPVAGESLLVGSDGWTVRGVQWEINQSFDPDGVTLRVGPTKENPE